MKRITYLFLILSIFSSGYASTLENYFNGGNETVEKIGEAAKLAIAGKKLFNCQSKGEESRSFFENHGTEGVLKALNDARNGYVITVNRNDREVIFTKRDESEKPNVYRMHLVLKVSEDHFNISRITGIYEKLVGERQNVGPVLNPIFIGEEAFVVTGSEECLVRK